MKKTNHPRFALPFSGTAVALLLTASLAGCSGGTAPTGADPSTSSSALTLSDGWVKASPDGMTAAFGTLKNTTGKDVVVTGAASPVSTKVELHETVADPSGQSTMREAKDGFSIPARGERVLEPGKDHIMFMDLSRPVNAGDRVEITLTTRDGGNITFTAPAKTFSGAKEKYQGGSSEPADHADHAGHGTPSPSGE